jgi:hypothetical protein
MALALLALFTHNNIFWVAALILALLKFPDVVTPLNDISSSLSKMTLVGEKRNESAAPQRDDDQRERGED